AGAVQLLPPNNPAQTAAQATYYSTQYGAMQGTVTIDSLELGEWDDVARTFTPGALPTNAVRVVVSRQSNGLIMSVLGVASPRLKARAVGWAQTASNDDFTRFLVDNEMFDPGLQWVKTLAAQLGKKEDDLLSDLNGDWFIDIPAGTRVEVPTGQVGDEALFDIVHPNWQFFDHTSPSFADFLNFNEDGTWRQNLVPKWMLDPLLGVIPISDPNQYPNYLTGGLCQVSPVYKSDISQVNVPPNSANGLGLRRGLAAFSMDSVGRDPDGPYGSVLPWMWITFCDPTSVAIPDIVYGNTSTTQRPIIAK
ncbi:MAG: TadG family pilus assembly protein, partial [Gammaproteobacteria bacterium]